MEADTRSQTGVTMAILKPVSLQESMVHTSTQGKQAQLLHIHICDKDRILRSQHFKYVYDYFLDDLI